MASCHLSLAEETPVRKAWHFAAQYNLQLGLNPAYHTMHTCLIYSAFKAEARAGWPVEAPLLLRWRLGLRTL